MASTSTSRSLKTVHSSAVIPRWWRQCASANKPMWPQAPASPMMFLKERWLSVEPVRLPKRAGLHSDASRTKRNKHAHWHARARGDCRDPLAHLVCCESGRNDEVALRRKGRTHLRPGAILSLSQRTATVPLLLRRGESEA